MKMKTSIGLFYNVRKILLGWCLTVMNG